MSMDSWSVHLITIYTYILTDFHLLWGLGRLRGGGKDRDCPWAFVLKTITRLLVLKCYFHIYEPY